VEEHLQASRRFYNNNVTRFNNLTEQFPSSIIASNHNFKAMELFKTEVEKLAKVSVSF
ncbi:MAG: LemA family protein, partial [Erysipelothrix sp.]|nr:LemA family protein [Erysipelothrix sp.]